MNEEIEKLKEELEELKEELKELEEGENEEDFKEFLNESYEPYKMGSMKFYAGDILKELDPIAFNEELNNYNDSEITQIKEKIEEKEEEIKEAETNE